jgi:hypothetical protein
MWTYAQRSGDLFAADGELVATGYAGAGEHKNRPESEIVRNKGPLPRGRYTMQSPRSTQTNGPYVIRLVPDPGNVMHGRTGFLIHGDSRATPGAASEGCIVLPRLIREHLWHSGDHLLKVVADL